MQVISRGSAVAYKRFRHATNKQLIAFVAAPLLGVLLVGLSLAVWKSEKVEPVRSLSAPPLLEARRAASSPAALPAKKTEPSPTAAPVEVVALSSPEASAAGLPKTEAPPPVKELAKSDAAIKAPDKPNIAKVRTLEETTGEAAVMRLVVVPWGEVYLDGRLQGVSPPLIELQVAPGEHVIEIWNTNFPPYKQTIQVKVGEKFKIKHKFGH